MHFLKAAAMLAPLLSVAEAARRTFRFSLSEGNYAPDGYSRKYTLINGASPGPVIEVNQGDDVEVIVTNTVAENATIHFHGIEMFRTPWNDGVPGVSQRPIKRGETYTYKWKATQYGSYWYHSHYRGQIEDGLYGAIVIHPKSSIRKPFSKISASEVAALTAAEANVKPLIIADVTHLHSHDKMDATVLSEIEISCYDSIVFNGKGNVNCLNHADVEAALTETQEMFLSLVPGSEMTDKACIPAAVINTALGGAGNPDLMPAGIFEGCTATTGRRETISAKSNKWIALDIIGANNFVLAVFSIDEHDMWVYAVDGEYINPKKVQAFELFNGDRISVFVKPKVAGAFKIRVHGATPPQMMTGHAILSVDGVRPRDTETFVSARVPNFDSSPHITLVGGPINSNVKFLHYNEITQFNAEGIPARADAFFLFNMAAESSWLWAMNTTRLDPHSIDTAVLPALFAPDLDETDNPVFASTLNNTWVDLVFVASTVPMPPHPIHKHGNKMWHIGSGVGDFTWNSVNEAIAARPELFNLVNPPKLDAVMTPGAETGRTWSAVRYHVTDPGTWAIHCHIHNHVEGGMLAVIQDGVDAWPTIPQEYWNRLW
jgi:FtsP/CotA-like multicopper oxidase with cupredoxin domain